MSDFRLQPANTLIVGMTGSGKTTFVNQYLLNDEVVACRFLFDDLNRMWPRLRLTPCYTLKDLEASLGTRWSVFQPMRAFGGDTKAAFRWWCQWVFHCATRGPGKKLVVVPELWRHCTEDSIPQELALLAQAGRELNVELVLDTQRPEALNPSITGQSTELVCFRLMSHEALRAVEKLWRDCGVVCTRERVASLPLGSFLAWNRLSGGSLSGRVF
ncbi:MAG: hypothetical protein KIS67_20235 [Verrucomicrobiae bacterium]|nr:hypothetical protein [Verrucomicrobiae bacterium]